MIGGFIIAEAIRKSGLASRLTYNMLNKFGTTPDRSVFTVVFPQGFYQPLSRMWWPTP